uniref:Uncharacterized protein n=1 Tax=Heterorhabditis bacteriophora TaxID=37862 RepID=A0A1I7WGE8_HETBA
MKLLYYLLLKTTRSENQYMQVKFERFFVLFSKMLQFISIIKMLLYKNMVNRIQSVRSLYNYFELFSIL